MDAIRPEPTVYLKPLLTELFGKWKTLLVFAVLGALLFGGYKAVPRVRSEPDAQTVSTTNKQLEANDGSIEDLRQQISQIEYDLKANATLIQNKQNDLDAFKDQIARTNEYLDVCRQSLVRVQAQLASASGQNAIALQEQFTTLTDSILDAQNTVASLNSSVASTEAEICDLRFRNESTLPANRKKAEREISRLEKDNEDLQELIAPSVERAGRKRIALYAAAGLIFGILVRAAWLVARVLLLHRLQDAEQITAVYGMPLLGSLHSSKHSKPDEAVVLHSAAAKLTMQLGEEQELLIAGTLPTAQIEAVAESLRPYLADRALRVIGDPALSADACQIPRRSAVLLVEQLGVSDVQAVARTMDILKLCEPKLVGLIEL